MHPLRRKREEGGAGAHLHAIVSAIVPKGAFLFRRREDGAGAPSRRTRERRTQGR